MTKPWLGAVISLLLLFDVAAPGTDPEPGLTLWRDFSYPQTPSFIDQTGPEEWNSSPVATVWSQRRKQRMASLNDPRAATALVPSVYVPPGALEPNRDYDFALAEWAGCQYVPGSFSFAGPADALIGITGFAWGTENNNGNFLPLLVRRDFREVKTPTLDFYWTIPPDYRVKGHQVRPVGAQITLDYRFRVAAAAKVDRAGAPDYRRFSAAGGASGRTPPIVPEAIFRWNGNGLEVFAAMISRAVPVDNRIAVPAGDRITGLAIDTTRGRLLLARSDLNIMCCTLDGTIDWVQPGAAPLLVRQNRLIAVSPDFRRLLVMRPDNGAVTGGCELPPHLPVRENCLPAVSDRAG
ncbi:MAG: hypothetical protein PHQ27_08930, partial [Victivallales bacterium]|nr:hypothetical protein [Victivallales bacterium]